MVNLVDHNWVTHKCIGWSNCRGGRGAGGLMGMLWQQRMYTHPHARTHTQFNTAVTSAPCTVHTGLCWATLGQEWRLSVRVYVCVCVCVCVCGVHV